MTDPAARSVFAQRRRPRRPVGSRRFGGCSSPTAARSPCGSSAPAASWGSRPWRSSAMRTPTRPMSGWPTTAVRLGPAPASGQLPPRRRDRRGGAVDGAPRRSIRATASSPSERPSRAAVEEAGLVFVGPSSATIAALGDKLAARRSATAAGVPVVPGTLEPAAVDRADAVAMRSSRRPSGIGFPLLVKAAAGGGGRGMRRVVTAAELPAALAAGIRRGAGRVRRRLGLPGARDPPGPPHRGPAARRPGGHDRCARGAGLLPPAPPPEARRGSRRRPVSRPEERRDLHELAVRAARAAGLRERGDRGVPASTTTRRFWFLEVNTRLQVEHGVTSSSPTSTSSASRSAIAAGPAAVRADPGGRRPRRGPDAPRDRGPPLGRGPGPGLRTGAGRDRVAGRCRRVLASASTPRSSAGERIPPDYDPLIAKILVVDSDRDRAAIDAAAPGPRRDGRDRDPDDAAVPPVHRPMTGVPAGRPRRSTGSTSTGPTSSDPDGPPRSRRPGGRPRLPWLAARPPAAGHPPRRPRQRRPRPRRPPPPGAATGRAAAVDRWPRESPMTRPGPRRPRRRRRRDEPCDLDPAAPDAPGSRRRSDGPIVVDAAARTARGEPSAPDPVRPPMPSGTAAVAEVVVDGWRFELEVEDAARARPAPAGHPRAGCGRGGQRSGRDPGDHSGTGRRRPGHRRRRRRGRPDPPRRGGDEDAERAPGASGRAPSSASPSGRGTRSRTATSWWCSTMTDERPRRSADVERWRATTRAKRPAVGRGAPGPVRDQLGYRDRGTSTPPRTSTRPGFDPTTRPRPARRAALHPGRPADDVPQPLLDDAPVRRASRPPRRRTSASATSSTRARRACRSPSTCRPRWATTRMRPRPTARSAGSASRSRSLADMEVLARRPAAGRGQHLDDDQRHRARSSSRCTSPRPRSRGSPGTGSRARPRTTS